MEEVYTVRVKWSPPHPGLSFPSERAYSSSTVGGLATAHLVLAALALTLSSIASAASPWRGELLGGAVLAVGGVIAGCTGALAWRKWYVDRYIRWFLWGSVASSVLAAVSGSLTAVLLLTAAPPLQANSTAASPAPGDRNNSTQRLVESSEAEVGELRHEIYIHLLLAAVVELVWSVLSVRLAWKGSGVGRKKAKEEAGRKGKELPPPPPPLGRPDILQNVRRDDPKYADVVRELCRLQGNPLDARKESHSGLPLPESRQEYGQRMERFLSGVATLS